MIQTYTDHYTGLIFVLQYTSVYLSVHTMYTGSLYLLIHAISCSGILASIFYSFLAQVNHYLPTVEILKKYIDWKIFARKSLRVWS